ncbi:site-specific integrase [Citrobacter braakii]
MLNENSRKLLPQCGRGVCESRAGYKFDPDELVWVLDRNVRVNTTFVRGMLDPSLHEGCISTLLHYAENLSPAHTRNIDVAFRRFLEEAGVSEVTPEALINYRSTLSARDEYRLGTLRGFLYKWNALGYPGVSDDVVRLLEGWQLRGNEKGDRVKRRDPTEGPLTDNELRAFNDSAVNAFSKELIGIGDLALALLLSHTGRRPNQLCELRVGDLDPAHKNNKGEPLFVIHIPRGKTRARSFRAEFKAFALKPELWEVLQAQSRSVIDVFEGKVGHPLQDADRKLLPLFPNELRVAEVCSVSDLRQLTSADYLHRSSASVTEFLKKLVRISECYSERTGDLLNVIATRFRYTTGTRAAREGFGEVVIAELLDHSDLQNAGVYIKDIPEHVEALDRAMGHQLAPYAQAFAGVLVDREEDATRGDDPSSRVRHRGAGAGTCGSFGFCGGNVPVPCYTCIHFQPWLNGPHEQFYEWLVQEKDRVLSITGDETVASAHDRTILAVAQVIRLCRERREEIEMEASRG